MSLYACVHGVDPSIEVCDECVKHIVAVQFDTLPESEIAERTLHEMVGFNEALATVQSLCTSGIDLISSGNEPRMVLEQIALLCKTYQAANIALRELIVEKLKERS